MQLYGGRLYMHPPDPGLLFLFYTYTNAFFYNKQYNKHLEIERECQALQLV